MSALRSIIRRTLRARGYDLRRYVTEDGPSLRLLELALEANCAAGVRPYFLQVGAHDGVLDDPLRPLVVKFQLPGLLVEPLPDAFAALQKTYAAQPGISFANFALWHTDGETEFYRVSPAAYPDPRAGGMAGLSREVLLRSSRILPGLDDHVERLSVATMSPATLFRRNGVTQVDLLVVDTEGFDDEIVKLVLEAGMNPAILYYEHIHLSPQRQDALAQCLAARQYRFARTRTDTLAMRELATDP